MFQSGCAAVASWIFYGHTIVEGGFEVSLWQVLHHHDLSFERVQRHFSRIGAYKVDKSRDTHTKKTNLQASTNNTG